MQNEYLENEDEYETDDEKHGILSRYIRRQNLSAEQIMTEDFKRVREQTERELMETYSVNSNNTQQMIENTKSILSRRKFQRAPGVGQEFKRQHIQKEYMNYGKYTENYIKREDEYDNYSKSYRNTMKRLNTK